MANLVEFLGVVMNFHAGYDCTCLFILGIQLMKRKQSFVPLTSILCTTSHGKVPLILTTFCLQHCERSELSENEANLTQSTPYRVRRRPRTAAEGGDCARIFFKKFLLCVPGPSQVYVARFARSNCKIGGGANKISLVFSQLKISVPILQETITIWCCDLCHERGRKTISPVLTLLLQQYYRRSYSIVQKAGFSLDAAAAAKITRHLLLIRGNQLLGKR